MSATEFEMTVPLSEGAQISGLMPLHAEQSEVTMTEAPTIIDIPQKSHLERAKDWIGTHSGRLALGMAATSAVVTLAVNPTAEIKHDVVAAAPWVGTGIAISEGMFVLGAGMMLASVGDKLGNPLKIKSKIPEIASKANNSNVFKTGFWINTTGAVGDFAVLTAGVVGNMPIESYGLLTLGLADLAVTVAVRKAIHNGIKSNSSHQRK